MADAQAGRGHEEDPDINAEFAALTAGLDFDVADLAQEPAETSDSALQQASDLPATPHTQGARTGEDETSPQPGMDDSAVPKAVKIAVVLTPLASADALAALCAMSELECTVVPASSGAIAVKEFTSAHSEWDVAELLGGADSEPAEAAELASALSRLSRAGVVLMTADLATDVGIESGLSGTMTARRYVNGEAGEEASAGLLLASMDQVVEDVLLGLVRAEDVPGAVKSSEVKPGLAMRWFGRGMPGIRGMRNQKKDDEGSSPRESE